MLQHSRGSGAAPDRGSRGQRRARGARRGGMAEQQEEKQCQPAADGREAARGGGSAPVHEVFGDVNLGAVILFLMLLNLLNYAMRDPCTC